MTKISVIIPAYNEASRIGETLRKIVRYLESKKFDYEIIVVDDGSSDGTAEIVRGFKNSRLKLLENKINRGKGYAVRYGMLEAKKDWILFTDADLSAPIEELDNFIKFTSQYDVVIASRALKNSKILIRAPWYRELGGKLINLAVQVFVLPGIHDTQCGFKLFRREAAQKIFPKQTLNNFSFDVEVLYLVRKYGYKILELPVSWSNSPNTKVKPFRDGLRLLFDLIKIRINDLKDLYLF